MTAIKTKVVTGEFRSATATNVRRLFATMARERAAAQTNERAIAVDGDPSSRDEPAEAVHDAPPSAPPRDNKKAVADVFASMMSRPVQVVPAAGVSGAPARAAVGRNDPCPCGSGKKYKKCCGRNQL
jgi:uncharacterized protein YecA (UPF0149 family)